MTDNERKECISALRQLLVMCDFVDQYGDFIDADPYFDAVETAIESLNETRWIPCSERLPKECDGSVLVSKEDEQVTTGLHSEFSNVWYIGEKANIPVSTLTENCWKTCDYFDVDTTRLYGNESPYFTVCKCKNLVLCRHAVDMFIKDREEK